MLQCRLNRADFAALMSVYRNDPKFLDRQFLNSADPDQTAPRGAV